MSPPGEDDQAIKTMDRNRLSFSVTVWAIFVRRLGHSLSISDWLQVSGFSGRKPRGPQNALPNINLLSCLNGRILRLSVTHLDEEMSAVISKLESCSNLLVIQRRGLAESFAPA
jgi:hypothetical protein